MLIYFIFSLMLMRFYANVHSTLLGRSYFVIDGRSWNDTIYHDMEFDSIAMILATMIRLLVIFLFLPVYYVLFDMIAFTNRKSFITMREFKRLRNGWSH